MTNAIAAIECIDSSYILHIWSFDEIAPAVLL